MMLSPALAMFITEYVTAAWPEAIRQGFEPARTVKTGTLKIDLLLQEDRA